MPMDVRCPGCNSTFPVTEAATASAVLCPYCDHEFTASLDRSAAANPPPVARPAGTPGKLTGTPRKTGAAAARRRRRDDEDDFDDRDDRDDRAPANGAWLMLAAAVGGLVVIGGLAAAAVLLMGGDDRNAADAPREAVGKPAAVANPAPDANPFPRPETPRPGMAGPKVPRVTTPPRPDPFAPPPDPTPPITPPAFPDPTPAPPPPKPTGFALAPVPGRPLDITPPTLAGETGPVTIDLGGRAETALVGGGGRFVVLHLPAKRKLAVFDASEGRVTREADLDAGADVVLAAGMNTLALADPGRRQLHRYTLPDLVREATGPLPPGAAVVAAAMGSATNGPLLLVTGQTGLPAVSLYDLAAMRPVEGSAGPGLPLPVRPTTVARAAANGTVFTVATPVGKFGPANVLAVRGGKWAWQRVSVAQPVPGPTGEVVFGAGETFTADGRPTGPKVGRTGQAVWLVPAADGPSVLKLTEKREGIGPKAKTTQVLTVHAAGDPQQPRVTVGELPELDGLVDWRTGVPKPLDRHLFYVARANLLVVLPAGGDRLVLRRVEVK